MPSVRARFEGRVALSEDVASIGVLHEIDSLPVAGRFRGHRCEEGEILESPRARLIGFLRNARQMIWGRVFQDEADVAVAVAIVDAGRGIDAVLMLIVRLGKRVDDLFRFCGDLKGQ
jgi:hypothetical protein